MQLRTSRLALTAATRIHAANSVAENLEQLPEFLVDQCVAGYWAVDGEVPLHAALMRLSQRQQSYHLPVLVSGNEIRFAPWHAGMPIKPNRFGIPEPRCPSEDLLAANTMNLVLVPLLGFDRNGNRLGSGGGYYDRSFAFLSAQGRPSSSLLVGVAYAFQELSMLAPEVWDIPLDYVVTERELIDCSAPRSIAS